MAQYAGYPVRLRRPEPQSEPLLALQIGDLMSDPAVRSRRARAEPVRTDGAALLRLLLRGAGRLQLRRQHRDQLLGFALRFTGARLLEAVPYHSRSARQPVPRSLRSRWRGDRIERLHSSTGASTSSSTASRRTTDCSPKAARGVLSDATSIARHEFALWANSARPTGRLERSPSLRSDRQTLVWGDALFDPSPPVRSRIFLAHSSPTRSTARRRRSRPLCPRPAAWVRQIRSLGFEPKGEPNGLSVVYVPFGLRDERAADRWHYTMGTSILSERPLGPGALSARRLLRSCRSSARSATGFDSSSSKPLAVLV
ncbi:MAG: hypothetical protein R2862_07635 [Thermoanaerobaculia bacterium]